MNKTNLELFIKKYYLQGTIESVKWVSNLSNKTLKLKAITEDKNVMAHVTWENVEFGDDYEIGVYDTSKLLKMLSVLDDDITVTVNKCNSGIASVLFSDNNTDVQFVAADLSVIPDVPNLKKIPDFNVEIPLTSTFISQFITSKSALADVNSFTFLMDKKNKLNIVLGHSVLNTNRIKLNVQPVDGKDKVGREINFNAQYFKDILVSNKDVDSGLLKISDAGLAMVEFKQGDFSSTYYMVEIKIA